MRDKLIKLIDVKTIITFAILGTLIYLALNGKMENDIIKDLTLLAVGSYFGYKSKGGAE
jgi:hypothetical protein